MLPDQHERHAPHVLVIPPALQHRAGVLDTLGGVVGHTRALADVVQNRGQQQRGTVPLVILLPLWRNRGDARCGLDHVPVDGITMYR